MAKLRPEHKLIRAADARHRPQDSWTERRQFIGRPQVAQVGGADERQTHEIAAVLQQQVGTRCMMVAQAEPSPGWPCALAAQRRRTTVSLHHAASISTLVAAAAVVMRATVGRWRKVTQCVANINFRITLKHPMQQVPASPTLPSFEQKREGELHQQQRHRLSHPTGSHKLKQSTANSVLGVGRTAAWAGSVPACCWLGRPQAILTLRTAAYSSTSTRDAPHITTLLLSRGGSPPALVTASVA
jgi:hypothetical protein